MCDVDNDFVRKILEINLDNILGLDTRVEVTKFLFVMAQEMSQFDRKLRNRVNGSIKVIKSMSEDDDVGMSWLFQVGDIW